MQTFISYCSPVQGRMDVASTGVHWFDSVVRGQHINNVWTVLTDNTYNASCRKITKVVM